MLDLEGKRIRVIVGHYGSGKTEFSVNYAIKLAEQGKKTALVDLDIANPYFRSREKKQILVEKGIDVYSNTFDYDITADLPAVTARIKAPLEDSGCITVIDAGGDDSGARILMQFQKYLTPEDSDIFCVINGNRPETNTVKGAEHHLVRIEKETGLRVTGLINNTHLIRATGTKDIVKGYELCRALSKLHQIPIKYHCCMEELQEELRRETSTFTDFSIFPIHLYMRDTWLDR
ncbi:ATP-binding protein [Sinanaerobacter chloroacetimidivorans]|jgi:hypothetical protein|uniref:ATP-binding protein n=1 Tax=Sinanaerobacter chloroacetimidivorans TaxID=2818044 RepID=A0A8J7VZY7_9FIRM|nr:ATP-binding protein [Sinanaerobacter chloroacetimidivorans]MBR0596715.1 ATP-binding protein [Sinanaerobacter chloroacetimidivorans]